MRQPAVRLLAGLLWSLAAFGCAHRSEPPPPPAAPSLDEAQVARLIPAKVQDREGWASDVIVAIRLVKKEPTAERVCAVLAVLEQESGYQADPPVSNLPGIVRRGLDEKLKPLGLLAGSAREALLSGKAPGTTLTFEQRIGKLRTERDLDRLFRDLADHYESRFPATFAVANALGALLKGRRLEDLNPVTTAGSMQVKVSYAQEVGDREGLSDREVRELLYTRGGGVRFGTARLIGYDASYDDILYRFADYNAGVYASRNAAFQAQLAEVTGTRLALDGDLLAYAEDGKPKDVETNSLRALLAFGKQHGLSASAVRRDAEQEKTRAFEETDLWKLVREAWTDKMGKVPPYARVPEVALSSPKLSRPRTTAWYADNVTRRYQACRARETQ
ncbi:MAG TPA: DUF1615 family protein [Myxococcaceae bacterium]|nr:DUF1615 family protein [Myxococcaceae bacterium]